MQTVYIVVNKYGEAFTFAFSKEDAFFLATDKGDRVYRVDRMTEVLREDS